MFKKIVIFVLAMFFLSTAWVGVTSVVKKQYEIVENENLPVKFNLIQSRWERLSGFNAGFLEELKKPAEFSLKFSGLDLNLVDFKLSEGLGDDFYLEVKKAYLDVGEESLFFTLNLEEKGGYLVRAVKTHGDVEIVGFELDSVLNYLRQGLEENQWFLVDGKKRVMASYEKAYVGKSHNIGNLYEEYSFTVSDKTYTFAVLKPQSVSFAFINFMGVLGIFFILMALYFYTEYGQGQRALAKASEGSFKAITKEALESNVLNESKDKSIFQDSDVSEDVRMVDLTNKKDQSELDYTEFLIDNPILGQTSKEENNVEVTAKAKPKEDEHVSFDEWVKLAEELSVNIDEFTQNLEKDKGLEENKA